MTSPPSHTPQPPPPPPTDYPAPISHISPVSECSTPNEYHVLFYKPSETEHSHVLLADHVSCPSSEYCHLFFVVYCDAILHRDSEPATNTTQNKHWMYHAFSHSQKIKQMLQREETWEMFHLTTHFMYNYMVKELLW